MPPLTKALERRTTTDVLFDHLHEEIVSLKLLPGTKLSESEVAQRFGVSRQPVRDAFNRLWNEDLLLIRPQKATEVRGFSLERISQARFLRLAVELEVIRNACKVWDKDCAEKLADNIDEQRRVGEKSDGDKFHTLDMQFHSMICELSGGPLAAEFLSECRQKTDRLCVLSFGRESEVNSLIDDHQQLANALSNRDVDAATEITRKHLSRLDKVIEDIHAAHAEYFE